jgi:putative flavoprotein involved in K+ transport
MIEKEVIVIGGGQAGLAMGYYLQKKRKDFLILDANERTGDNWRNRYDSLFLFTPRGFNHLPGLAFQGAGDGLPRKDEAADYLERYASYFSLPIHRNTKVWKLQKLEQGFQIWTNQGEYLAKQVVIATGPFQKPVLPAFSNQLPDHVYQVHSSSYRNPSQLQEGSVMVVGAGNSGAQIAVELAHERQVHLSVGHSLNFKPLYVLGKSIFWYFDKLGLLQAEVNSRKGAWLHKQPEQIYGLELKRLIHANRIQIKPRAIGAEKGNILFEDGTSVQAQNVIWATGFRSDFDWIALPGVLDTKGAPLHDKGVSPVHGIYFVGLPWQSRRGSALMGWVGQDAKYVMSKLDVRQ